MTDPVTRAAAILREHRESIDRIVTNGKKMEIAGRIGAGFDQTPAKAVKIVVDFGIVDVTRLAQANLVHDALADPALDLRREFGARRLAEIGKIIGQGQRRSGNGGGQRQRQKQAAKKDARGARIHNAYDNRW